MHARMGSRRRTTTLTTFAAVITFLGVGFFLWPVQTGVAQNSGTEGVISGSVTVDRGVVRAFRVQVRDTIHRLTYTVFTNKGQYDVFNLPSSTYELRVVEEGFDSPVHTVTLNSGETKTADLALKAREPGAGPELVDFDTLYPPGPGRDILVRSCFGCHGSVGWHRRAGRTEAGWRRGLDRMSDVKTYLAIGKIAGIALPPMFDQPLPAHERETVIKYLAAHFPLGRTPRDLKLDPLVRDEDALAQAVYILYDLPAVQGGDFSDGTTPGRGTHDVYPSEAMPGTVWVTGLGAGSVLAVNTLQLDYANRTKEWRVPIPGNLNVRPHSIVEHDGRVYHTSLTLDGVGEFNPTTGESRIYSAPTKGGGGHTLRVDSKGNIWFTTIYGRSRINRVDAVTKEVTEYDPSNGGANWYGIVIDKQDRVWASGSRLAQGVFMYDPRTDKWTSYPMSATGRRVTIDPQGKAWSNQYFGNAIASVDPETGKVTEYKLPLKYGNPYEGWSDLEGNIWIDNAVYNSLVKFDQSTETFTYFPFPILNAHAPKIEVDEQGTLWFGLGSPRRDRLAAFKPKGNVPMRSSTTR